MRIAILLVGILTLTSCVGNVSSSRLVLSEPNDHVSVQTLTHKHELYISEDRILFYNNEEKFLVPQDQLVIFQSDASGETTFTLMDKEGRKFNFTFDI